MRVRSGGPERSRGACFGAAAVPAIGGRERVGPAELCAAPAFGEMEQAGLRGY